MSVDLQELQFRRDLITRVEMILRILVAAVAECSQVDPERTAAVLARSGLRCDGQTLSFELPSGRIHA